MLIGIDGNEANIKNRVGINQYAWELMKEMYKQIENGEKKHQVIVYLKNMPLSDMPKENSFWHYRVLPGGGLWILRKLTKDLFTNPHKPDVFFSPSHYVPPFSPIPRVCTITDLGYLEFSEQFKKTDFWQLKHWSAWSINVSKAIITISESTKNDVVRHYPSASKKTFVTLLGYDKSKYKKDIFKEDVRRVLKKYSIVNEPKSYVLFLSTLKPSKNIESLLAAWADLSNQFNQLNLIIAGKKGWMYAKIFEQVEKLGLEKKVIFTDFVDEEDKPALIAGSYVFVLPSYWEGFGLDPLNAMACGVPVIVSNIASLPEVVGDAGILIDPYNVNSIKKGIEKVITMNSSEYKKVVDKGFKQASKFSWETTAKQTFDILEKVTKNV